MFGLVPTGSAFGWRPPADHPSWLFNLAHNPDQAWVEIDKDKFKVKPELLAGEERSTAWRRIVAEAPGAIVGGQPTASARSGSGSSMPHIFSRL